MIGDSDYLSLAVCTFSLEKCLFKSLAHFGFELFVFVLLSFMNSLYLLNMNPLSDIRIENIFYHSMDCLFTSFTVSFYV